LQDKNRGSIPPLSTFEMCPRFREQVQFLLPPRFHGVMVSTSDSESEDLGSIPSGTIKICLKIIMNSFYKSIQNYHFLYFFRKNDFCVFSFLIYLIFYALYFFSFCLLFYVLIYVFASVYIYYFYHLCDDQATQRFDQVHLVLSF
jgi:hypothetical protein